MPKAGVEPAWGCPQWFLRPSRLPFRHFGAPPAIVESGGQKFKPCRHEVRTLPSARCPMGGRSSMLPPSGPSTLRARVMPPVLTQLPNGYAGPLTGPPPPSWWPRPTAAPPAGPPWAVQETAGLEAGSGRPLSDRLSMAQAGRPEVRRNPACYVVSRQIVGKNGNLPQSWPGVVGHVPSEWCKSTSSC